MSEEKTEAKPAVVIQDVQEFGRYLIEWHSNAVAMVEHYRTMPQGEVMEVQNEGEEPQKIHMVGKMHKGFMLGLTLALSQLGKLPFGQSELPVTPENEQTLANLTPASNEPIH